MELLRDVDGGVVEVLGLPKILVVGVGGAGNNTINRLAGLGIDGAQTLAVNTDAQQLKSVAADKKVLIGQSITRGLGAGGEPEMGRLAAEQSRPDLERALDGADLVFLTAGLGGGTGTGAAPVVAEIARQRGSTVVALVTMPFQLERSRFNAASSGLQALSGQTDTMIVMDNNRLLEIAPNLPVAQAFALLDQLAAEIIKGMAETITRPSLINLDYADLRTVMRCGGHSCVVVGEGSLRNPDKVVGSALGNPLLPVDIRGATGCLLHITGGQEMTLRDAACIASTLTAELDPQANVIWGARVERDMGHSVRIMAIIAGAVPIEPGRQASVRRSWPKADLASRKEARGITS
ncbi:MAG: Cell division protein FtsZ 1 [Methanosaeta sp. PtaU1.Bin028]|nr:MAG: Cell division protein FtsZ 1 [Methanosaeta sp. PtaU1.Bin028]